MLLFVSCGSDEPVEVISDKPVKVVSEIKSEFKVGECFIAQDDANRDHLEQWEKDLEPVVYYKIIRISKLNYLVRVTIPVESNHATNLLRSKSWTIRDE